MGFVERELDRLAAALREPQPPERYAQLHAAQQALAWTTEPQGFAAPLDMIDRDYGAPIMGTPIVPTGCSDDRRQIPS